MRGDRGAAALLLAFLAAAALLPALAAGAARRGCHCPVRMACCEDGTCTMTEGDEPPAEGPEWRPCRRGGTDDLAPLSAFDHAAPPLEGGLAPPADGPLGRCPPRAAPFATPRPLTPPPR